MRHKILFLTAFLTAIIIIPLPLVAQDEQEATSSSETDEIREQIEQQVEQRLQQITTRPIGLVGYLDEISETHLIVSDLNQNTFRVITDDQTELLQIPGRRSIERSELALQDPLIIKGEFNTEQDRLLAFEIQVLSELEPTVAMSLLGTVQNVNQSDLVITDDQNQNWEIITDRSTKYISPQDSEALEDAEIEEDDQILILGDKTDDFEINALVIFPLTSSSMDDNSEQSENE